MTISPALQAYWDQERRLITDNIRRFGTHLTYVSDELGTDGDGTCACCAAGVGADAEEYAVDGLADLVARTGGDPTLLPPRIHVPFCYTTGLFGVGHAELVVVGLDRSLSARMLNEAAHRCSATATSSPLERRRNLPGATSSPRRCGTPASSCWRRTTISSVRRGCRWQPANSPGPTNRGVFPGTRGTGPVAGANPGPGPTGPDRCRRSPRRGGWTDDPSGWPRAGRWRRLPSVTARSWACPGGCRTLRPVRELRELGHLRYAGGAVHRDVPPCREARNDRAAVRHPGPGAHLARRTPSPRTSDRGSPGALESRGEPAPPAWLPVAPAAGVDGRQE